MFGHAELLDIWSNNSRSEDAVRQHIFKKIGQNNLNECCISLINKKVKSFFDYIRKHLPGCNRSLDRLKKKHFKWLASSISIIADWKTPNKVGRPKLVYEKASDRLKRKLASDLADENNNSVPLLLHAASVSAKKGNEKDMAVVLKAAGNSDNINNIKRKMFSSEPTQMSVDNALAFLFENGFTKSQYINLKRNTKVHGFDIYPSYPDVLNAKLKLRPNGIEYFENKAQVELQQLLNHTTSRILEMQYETFKANTNSIECQLIFSYGYDGSTGQSIYKQRYEEIGAVYDGSLFVTTIVPLKLVDNEQKIIWINRSPQSIRFCRPLKIEFIKETRELILAEKENLDTQIRNLHIYLHKINNIKIFVKYVGQMTLIDGKVLNILTGCNSCQCCPICGAKPTHLMNVNDFNSDIFDAKSQTLQFGISPLHAWIRFFEFVLKLAYRADLKTWHVKDIEKPKLVERKHFIQKQMMEKMGLNVDKPLPNGSGNSNDGNTARRAFSNTALLSSILNIDYDILYSFYIILITISSEYEIDSEKFKTFCKNVFLAYQNKYPWYPMSPTVHKVLVHGHQIIDNCFVPVGCLGEHASESRNKLYKSDRRRHARKCSRLDTMTDIFNRALDTSDPLLSSIYLKERQRKNKNKNMPQEVISLLKSPCVGSDHDDHGDCQDIDEGEEDDERELIQKDHELDVIASDEEFF